MESGEKYEEDTICDIKFFSIVCDSVEDQWILLHQKALNVSETISKTFKLK